MNEIEDLEKLLRDNEAFRTKYGYNPHDNYVWREIMSFNYLKDIYPTIQKVSGRYKEDGNCPELNLKWIEHKSTNKLIRKKSQTYNFDKIYFEFDTGESRMRHMHEIDGFIFGIYDRGSVEHPNPVSILFVYGENLKTLISIIEEEKKRFFDEGIRKRDTIEIYYQTIAPLAEVFGVKPEPLSNIMEFIL